MVFPDDVDLGVVGDGFEGDVGDALIDEAVGHVAVDGFRAGGGANDFRFLELALAGIRQQVIGITRAHDAGAGQGEGHAGGVDRDPAAAPLLGHRRRGAGTAGRIENEIAGVGGHEEAAFNDLGTRLYDIGETSPELNRFPTVIHRNYWKIIHSSKITQGSARWSCPACQCKMTQSAEVGFECARAGCVGFAIELELTEIAISCGSGARQRS